MQGGENRSRTPDLNPPHRHEQKSTSRVLFLKDGTMVSVALTLVHRYSNLIDLSRQEQEEKKIHKSGNQIYNSSQTI